MVFKSVGNSIELKEELLELIVGYNDLNEAFKWAVSFNIPVENRPFCIRNMTQVSQTEQKY